MIIITFEDDMHVVYKASFTVASYCMTSSLMLAFLQPLAYIHNGVYGPYNQTATMKDIMTDNVRMTPYND